MRVKELVAVTRRLPGMQPPTPSPAVFLRCRLLAGKDLKAGEEVTITYGNMRSDELLLYYGYGRVRVYVRGYAGLRQRVTIWRGALAA